MRVSAALIFVVLLAGCVKDAPAPVPAPDLSLPETVTGMTQLGLIDDRSAAGIWLHDDMAFLSGSPGLRILDISDPRNATVLAEGVPETGSRDVDILEHPNGKTYAVLGANDGVILVDASDPTVPEVVSKTELCSHNIAVVPNSTLVYSSWSVCQTSNPEVEPADLEIIDFADPAAPQSTLVTFPPVVVTEGGTPRMVTAQSCHDFTFTPERSLAYCGGLTQTLIFDITTPMAPEIIQVIDWPGTSIHHAVWPARGGDLLVIGDEFAGVLTPSPPCSDQADAPLNALWFFDVSDMSTPTPVGHFQLEWDQMAKEDEGGQTPRFCSTHFGSLIEDRDMLVMGWYAGGVVVVDFQDPSDAQQVAHWVADGRTSVWEARYYKGHIYTGDQLRGMDVLKLT